MPIAQMNWGRLRYSPDDPRLAEFMASLGEIYALAERHPGFVWRIPDEHIAAQMQSAGFDDRTSATVSVWSGVEALRAYTYDTAHGAYLKRNREWFDVVEGPQLVIWTVAPDDRPDFFEALKRLEHLKAYGPTDRAFGWEGQIR